MGEVLLLIFISIYNHDFFFNSFPNLLPRPCTYIFPVPSFFYFLCISQIIPFLYFFVILFTPSTCASFSLSRFLSLSFSPFPLYLSQFFPLSFSPLSLFKYISCACLSCLCSTSSVGYRFCHVIILVT